MYRHHTVFRALAVAVFVAILGVASPASAVTIDFETDGLGNPLSAGDFITNEWESIGITVGSSFGALRLFNSNCGPGFPGTPCTGGDGDLASGFDFGNGFVPAQGNVLIRQDGGIAEPGDTGVGGTIRFDFAQHVRLISIALLDNDNTGGITLNIFKNGAAVPSDSILRPAVGFNNFFEEFAFAGFDATWVTRLDVVFAGSGAIAALTVEAVPLPAALPLLLSALAWLGWATRRRRSAAAA